VASSHHHENEESSTALHVATAPSSTTDESSSLHVVADVTAKAAAAKNYGIGSNNSNKLEPTKMAGNYDYTYTMHKSPTSSTNIKIKSKPQKNGKWNPKSPLEWCQSFGSRSPSTQQRLSKLIRLQPDDDGYISPSENNSISPRNVTIVRTREQAQIVLKALEKSKQNEPCRIHACDTEVMDIDLSTVGPVGNGYVTCLSVYSGPDFDYGLNDLGPGTMLWIDNLDDACGVLNEFKSWLEDETVLKVWHNYGFDRHVLWNEGINVLGFGGDTS
jgi:hypothetical protein